MYAFILEKLFLENKETTDYKTLLYRMKKSLELGLLNISRLELPNLKVTIL